MANLFATKSVEAFRADLSDQKTSLKRALGPLNLVMLGVGGIIGTGIFVLTGVAAKQDRPGPWLHRPRAAQLADGTFAPHGLSLIA